MKYVTVENLKEFHRYAIDSGAKDESSLRDAVLNEGTLFYICDCANRIKNDLERASLLLHHISTMHPFIEGNKRTAIFAAEDAIGIKMMIDAEEEELYDFVIKVASDLSNVQEIKKWLKERVCFRG